MASFKDVGKDVGADDAGTAGAAAGGACLASSPPGAGELVAGGATAGGAAAGESGAGELGAGELAAGEPGDGEVEGVGSCAAAGKTEARTRKNENKRGRRIRIKPSGRIKPTEKKLVTPLSSQPAGHPAMPA